MTDDVRMKGRIVAFIGTFILCFIAQTTAQTTNVNPCIFIVLAFLLGNITSDM